MARLDFHEAQLFARRLKTIPGFWDEDLVIETANDLVVWCTGAIIDRECWAPAAQADWLVTHARETWEKWQGTAGLKQAFLAKFPAQEKREDWQPATYQELIARGLIRPPCQRCDDRGLVGQAPEIEFCTCPEGRRMRKWEGDRFLVQINQAVRKPSSLQNLHERSIEEVRAEVERAEVERKRRVQ